MPISKKWFLPGTGLAAVALVLWGPWAEGDGPVSKSAFNSEKTSAPDEFEPPSLHASSPESASSAQREELVPKPASAQSAHDSHKEQTAFWWDDPVQYEAYVKLFYKHVSEQQLPTLGNLDPEPYLVRLKDLNENLTSGEHDFLTGVNWVELGELADGKDVAYVLRSIREMEEYDLEKMRFAPAMLDSFVYDTPLLVAPKYVIGHVLGKKIQPSIEQSKEIERLYWAHLGDRARLDKEDLFWTGIDMGAQGDLGVLNIRTNDSFVRPAELAKIEDQVREINRRYIDSLTAYAIAEGLVD